MIGAVSISGSCARFVLDAGKVNGIGREEIGEMEALLAGCERRFPEPIRLLSIEISPGGKRIFCAGANQKERESWTVGEKLAHIRHQRGVIHRLRQIPQWVVCCVDGLAIGLGVEICLAADFVLSTRRGGFSFPERGLGIIPGAGGYAWAHHLAVRREEAVKFVESGAELDGDHALRLGIVDAVVDEAQDFQLQLSCMAEYLSTISPEDQAARKRARLASVNFREIFDEEQAAYEACLVRNG